MGRVAILVCVLFACGKDKGADAGWLTAPTETLSESLDDKLWSAGDQRLIRNGVAKYTITLPKGHTLEKHEAKHDSIASHVFTYNKGGEKHVTIDLNAGPRHTLAEATHPDVKVFHSQENALVWVLAHKALDSKGKGDLNITCEMRAGETSTAIEADIRVYGEGEDKRDVIIARARKICESIQVSYFDGMK